MSMHGSVKYIFILACLLCSGMAGQALAGNKQKVILPQTAKVIVLPPETATLKPGNNSALAQAVCSDCHSVDYPTTQPILTRSQWQAEINKMRDAFGAGPTWAARGVTDTDLQNILDYLVANYGKED